MPKFMRGHGSVFRQDLSLSVAVERLAPGFLPASAVHRMPFPLASGHLFPGVLLLSLSGIMPSIQTKWKVTSPWELTI